MTDIVERLRHDGASLAIEAADEIERLQKQCTGMANAALNNGQGLILYERALIQIKELAASEADEPLDEAIKIATDALGFTSPELQFDERA